MANPQREHGYTGIANEILDEIMKANLNGTQFRLVIAIWRNTYGYQRKHRELSVTYLAEVISSSRSAVDRELKVLIARNVINSIEIGQKGARVLSFNKNYKEWDKKESSKEPVPEIKTNKKPKQKKTKYTEENTYYKMAVYFHTLITAVAKEAGVEHLVKKANLQNYADEFRKLVELDGVTKKQAKEVMDWVTQHSFWKTNILSAKKLRDKFMDLAIRMNEEKKPSQPKQQPDHRDMEIALQQWIAEGKDPDEFQWTD